MLAPGVHVQGPELLEVALKSSIVMQVHAELHCYFQHFPCTIALINHTFTLQRSWPQ